MGFPSMHEGIWQCEGCKRTYPEYINGCLEDHDRPRSVRLVIEEPAEQLVPIQPHTFGDAYAPRFFRNRAERRAARKNRGTL